MTMDRQFLRLSERWALAYDRHQWIVQQFRPPKWRPVAFVEGSKAVLMRVLREKGAVVSVDAGAALNRLPDSFRLWHDALDRQGRELGETTALPPERKSQRSKAPTSLDTDRNTHASPYIVSHSSEYQGQRERRRA